MYARALQAMFRAAILAAVATAPAPTHAGDGAIEINQTCAVMTGCDDADSPGFPVTIYAGRHVLTSDLATSDPSQTAIQVNGALVWLDLQGFTISGPTSCTSPGPACSPTGSGSGIVTVSSGYTTIVNGTVRGFGSDGIAVNNNCRVQGVLVTENGRHGLATGLGCVVRGVRAVRNGSNGIVTGANGVLAHNLADGNGAAGMRGEQGSVFVDNTSDGNGAEGIGGYVGGNVVNDNHARGNALYGIRASAGAIVEGNTVADNGALGLFLNGQAGYGFNVIRPSATVPGSTTVSAGAQNLGDNLCNGVTTCP